MADNTNLNSMTGGDIISTDVITTLNGAGIATGEKAQRVKVGWGADATFNDTTAANPLPVVQTGTPALPTGAATAAKQPALGTAGTASADVLTVQGKASMTPLLVDGSAVTQPVSAASLPLPTGSATSANQSTQITSLSSIDGKLPVLGQTTMSASQPVAIASDQSAVPVTSAGAVASGATDSGNPIKVGGKYNTTKPTFTDGQRADLQVDSRGNLIVSIAAASGVTQSSVLAPADAQAAQNGLMANVQPAVYNGTTYDRQRSATAASGTTGTGLAGVGVLGFDGTNYQRLKADSSGILYSNVVATATGGYTPAKLISAATTNATSVKASAGTLGFMSAGNISGSPRYIKLYNKASAPTVGTDVPVQVYVVPGNTAGSGFMVPLPGEGLNFSTGIAFAITAGITDADTTAVGASEVALSYGTA